MIKDVGAFLNRLLNYDKNHIPGRIHCFDIGVIHAELHSRFVFLIYRLVIESSRRIFA